MKLEEQDIVTFDNGKEYVIVKILNYNNNRYFYFSSIDELVQPKYIIMKEIKEKDKYTFGKLTDEEFELVKTKLMFNIAE